MYGTLISSVTVGAGGAASIDFNSIPQTYTDLIILMSTMTGGSDGTIKMTFNGSTSTYANRLIYGNGSTKGSQTNTIIIAGKAFTSATETGNSIAYIPNYTNSSAKSMMSDVGQRVYLALNAGSWTGTSAITSISLTTPNDVAGFSQYSNAYLYGLTKGSGGATVA